jgi:hypothetical protein
MNPSSILRDNRVQAAKIFAQEFNRLEWKYLCSYPWLMTSMDRALDTGDFFPIQIKAEHTLVNGKIRMTTATVSMDPRNHNSDWWLNDA